ncbi:hypothetical protein RJ641_034224, partial [Dillenia turbinata]
VSIIPFRGDITKVLLPPSRSIVMARKHLERFPCGGGSPLAHGLTIAVRVGLNTPKSGNFGHVMIVAITDGKANISLKHSIDLEVSASNAPKPSAQKLKDEILEVTGKIYKAGMSLLIIKIEINLFGLVLQRRLQELPKEKIITCQMLSDAIISATTREALSSLKNYEANLGT